MFVPRPTSKSKLFSSDSWFSISQLVSASNPSPHHYCGTSTGGWISSVLIANIPDRSERGQLTDCIPGDYLFVWHSICCQPWVWKIFIWFWMIRYNDKREIFINSIIPWGYSSVKLIALETYLAMDMCMSKHACHQPICKNRGWFYIEEAIWNVDPMPHTTQLSRV
jgi:hypothetical protein